VSQLSAGRWRARSERTLRPGGGADYHQPDWQRSFWDGNYARLLEIKHAYDPGNRFRVHHGVGSE
jgi:hypothetical protein